MFVHYKNYVINLDNVTFRRLDKSPKSTVLTIYFNVQNGSHTLVLIFKGSEADDVYELIREAAPAV